MKRYCPALILQSLNEPRNSARAVAAAEMRQGGGLHMELVAQLAERQIVVLDAVGSIPTFLPILHIYCSSGASQSQGAARLTERCM